MSLNDEFLKNLNPEEDINPLKREVKERKKKQAWRTIPYANDYKARVKNNKDNNEKRKLITVPNKLNNRICRAVTKSKIRRMGIKSQKDLINRALEEFLKKYDY